MKGGENVWIHSWDHTIDLASEIGFSCRQHGAHSLITLMPENYWIRSLIEVPKKLLEILPTHQAAALEKTDVFIFMLGPRSPIHWFATSQFKFKVCAKEVAADEDSADGTVVYSSAYELTPKGFVLALALFPKAIFSGYMQHVDNSSALVKGAKIISGLIGRPMDPNFLSSIVDNTKIAAARKDFWTNTYFETFSSIIQKLLLKWRINLDEMSEEEIFSSFSEEIKNLAKNPQSIK